MHVCTRPICNTCPNKSRLMQREEALLALIFFQEDVRVSKRHSLRKFHGVWALSSYEEKLLAEKLMVQLQRENKKMSIVFEKSSGNLGGTAFYLDQPRCRLFKLANFDNYINRSGNQRSDYLKMLQ